MDIASLIPSLGATLGSSSEILTDPEDIQFRDLIKRWTDIDLQIPAAIVLPTSEVDCQKAVRIEIPGRGACAIILTLHLGSMGYKSKATYTVYYKGRWA